MKHSFDSTSPRDHNLRMRFVSAAENGAIGPAREILYQGVLNDETLDLALSRAASEGQADFVKFLVDEINIDLTRKGGEVLAQAVRARETEVVDVMTVSGVIPLNAETPLDTHYLDLALLGQNPYCPELLQLLLDRGAKPMYGKADALETALRAHNEDALQRFLASDKGARARLGDKLTSAAMRLDPAGVELLLKNGAQATHNQNAPLRGLLGQMEGRKDDDGRIYRCARLLLDAHLVLAEGGGIEGLKQEVLKAAIRTRNAPLICDLLDSGTDVEPQMRGIGYNRMVLAALCSNAGLVEKFHKDGKTAPEAYTEAISVAAELGNLKLVDQMLGYGLDPKSGAFDLAFCAAVGGQLDLVKTFEARGLPTDLTAPVLVEAVIAGNHGAMLDYMLDRGADHAKAYDVYLKTSNNSGKSYADTWEVLKAWSERGETVLYSHDFGATLPELRRTEPDYRDQPLSGIIKLAKANRFSEVLDIAHKGADGFLTKADMLSTDGRGNTLLEILGARRQLSLLFAPALWQGRAAEFIDAVAELPPVYQGQVDEQGFVAILRQEALAKLKNNIPKLKGVRHE